MWFRTAPQENNGSFKNKQKHTGFLLLKKTRNNVVKTNLVSFVFFFCAPNKHFVFLFASVEEEREEPETRKQRKKRFWNTSFGVLLKPTVISEQQNNRVVLGVLLLFFEVVFAAALVSASRPKNRSGVLLLLKHRRTPKEEPLLKNGSSCSCSSWKRSFRNEPNHGYLEEKRFLGFLGFLGRVSEWEASWTTERFLGFFFFSSRAAATWRTVLVFAALKNRSAVSETNDCSETHRTVASFETNKQILVSC